MTDARAGRVTRDSIPRVDVLGVGVSVVTMQSAVAEVARWIAGGERRYVCATGVHGVMESQRNS
jgi:N-acetylglucosaminyldiphosphoundecaprenol N-acetyl-beta-D-mannosaminyltransferase